MTECNFTTAFIQVSGSHTEVYFSIYEDIKTLSRRGGIYAQITSCDKELLLRVPNECVVK